MNTTMILVVFVVIVYVVFRLKSFDQNMRMSQVNQSDSVQELITSHMQMKDEILQHFNDLQERVTMLEQMQSVQSVHFSESVKEERIEDVSETVHLENLENLENSEDLEELDDDVVELDVSRHSRK